MKKPRNAAKPVTVEAIARLADQGKDISGFFKSQGRMVQPIQRVSACHRQNAGPAALDKRGSQRE